MIKKQKRPRDVNQRAASTVELATSQITEDVTDVKQETEATPEERHNAAITLGRKGGQMRAKKLTTEQRKEIALIATKARWGKIIK